MVLSALEQRRHPRMPLSNGLRFRVLAGSDPAAYLQATACDLSQGGLAVNSPASLQGDDVLKVEMDFEGGQSVHAFATVAWARPTAGGCQAGLRFIGIGEKDEDRIAQAVADFIRAAGRRLSKN